MPRHPNKEIEAALSYARTKGWTVIKPKGHCWGCSHGESETANVIAKINADLLGTANR